jgi:hypothetical protein
MRDIDEFFELLKGRARKTFLKAGTHMPVFVTDEDVIPCPWENNAQKHFMVGMVRVMFKAKNVQRYGLIFEMWFTQTKLPDTRAIDAANFTPPSQDPKRQEGVAVMVEDRDGNRRQGAWLIERINGEPRIKEFITTPNGEALGTFGDMFGTRVTH